MIPQLNLEQPNTNNDFLREVSSQQTIDKTVAVPATSKQIIKKKPEQIDESLTNSNSLTGGRRLQLVSRGTEFLPQNSLRNNNLPPKRFHSSQNQRNRFVFYFLKKKN